jgi:hypothetical protein
MASITLSERDLVTRQNSLHVIFAALRNGKKRVAFGIAKDSPGGTQVLVAKDHNNGRSPYRDESFQTSVKALRCKYFEMWQVTGGDKLLLNRAYFTLLRVNDASRSFDELLCIHTDPADAEVFKQGPHLHVTCAKDPIPHCHFPLELGALEMALKDCDALTSAMRRAIGVVAKEVIPHSIPK